ncbi:Mss4-like protein [Clohesyomyces aquaticus]|uniref:Mss4-like protein n=1 Tax=Clohesyomyces aquaticus TaxID=1231657 RepID=A0A1Y1YFT4_9PLEO|nr:Mss4-like protein [Clohesyomyces aquaticus]
MNGSCQCGAIIFTTPVPTPIRLYHCHCLDCRKQSGSAFGTSAIFPFFKLPDPEVNPAVSFFSRVCESGRRQNCYFCNKCGSRILHAHQFDDGVQAKVVAVKGGMLEGLKWEGAAHIYCRSAVVGIPEGVERWEADPDFSKKSS